MTIPNTIKEAVKEAARVILLAVVAFLLTTGVIDQAVVTAVGNRLDTNTILIISGLITSALRGFVKWLHEHAKAQDTGGNKFLGTKGLTGF